MAHKVLPFSDQQFGGPILKDKLFFFFAYEGERQPCVTLRWPSMAFAWQAGRGAPQLASFDRQGCDIGCRSGTRAGGCLGGQYDAARDRLRKVLAIEPKNFQALTVYVFVEAGLQDFPVAAELYHRALAIQDAPALRLALAKLPSQ